ncbi:MAG TPA: orotate phosphoribosyltransferase [Kofleriaceae bacterium]|nr:orotate phosphoribosyltransferase [Kofleriaceae bacterium]
MSVESLFAMPEVAAWRARLHALLRERAFQEREIVLSSGLRSNFYIDCKQVSLNAEGASLIGKLFCALIEQLAPDAAAVGGLTLGADPLATATSLVSFERGRPRDAFIVRKEPKGHGTGQWIEHTAALRPGAEVVVVEDVVTTGGSMLRAIERVTDAGLQVKLALALVDRAEGGRPVIEARAPLVTLFSRGDFLP